METQQNKIQERMQGNKIKDRAETIWGWNSPAGLFRVQRRIEEFSKFIKVTNASPELILEVGCGTCVFTSFFVKKGLKLIAVDISLDLLKKAKEKYPHLNILQADAENLPFKERSFDYVIGVSVLHHFNLKPALRSMFLVLKDRGALIFSEPNSANPQIFLQKRIKWFKKIMHDTPTEGSFSRWEIKKTLEENSFSPICIYPFEFLHPLTPKRLIPFIKKMELYLERLPVVKEIAGSLLIFSKKL